MGARVSMPRKRFGNWIVAADNSIYCAPYDGFVCAERANTGVARDVLGRTSSIVPPDVTRDRSGSSDTARGAGVSFPVRYHDYWKTLYGTNIFWITLEP